METFYLEVVAAGIRGEIDSPYILIEALRKEGVEPTGGPVQKVKESLEEWWGIKA